MHTVRHVAINADDVERARAFYAQVFGWDLVAWGPPGFYRTETPGGPVVALQSRRELIAGERTVGFECTFDVADADLATAAAVAAGGTVLMAPVTIPGVGTLAWVRDTEGNPFGLMQYDAPRG